KPHPRAEGRHALVFGENLSADFTALPAQAPDLIRGARRDPEQGARAIGESLLANRRPSPHMGAMQDNLVAPFSLDNAPVRGRIARLGASLDPILRRHDYPRPVAMLLGEALALAALVGSLLKTEGRLIVQAQ